jgi:hypothetical protein
MQKLLFERSEKFQNFQLNHGVWKFISLKLFEIKRFNEHQQRQIHE